MSQPTENAMGTQAMPPAHEVEVLEDKEGPRQPGYLQISR